MKWLNKFKGNQKKLEWFLKQHKKGKINAKIPELTSWEIRIVEFFSLCVKDNGLCIADLDCLFERLNIQSSKTFYETALILNRCYLHFNNKG